MYSGKRSCSSGGWGCLGTGSGTIPILAIREAQRHDLLEDRYGDHSTIVTSQLHVSKGHEWVNDPTVADAILDRLAHNAYKVELKGPSGRKEKASS